MDQERKIDILFDLKYSIEVGIKHNIQKYEARHQ